MVIPPLPSAHPGVPSAVPTDRAQVPLGQVETLPAGADPLAHGLTFFLYFAIGIFFFKTSIRAIDITEIRKAVMNIILYDSKEGNERLEPFIDI